MANVTYTWVLSKRNSYKLLIHKIADKVTVYEGNRIPLSDNQLNSIIAYLSNKGIAVTEDTLDGYIIDKADNDQIYNAFISSFNSMLVATKNNDPDNYKPSVRNKIKCLYKGQYKLIRSASKDEIHIARRRATQDNPYDVSTQNVVCIPDNWKKQFFADADELHNAIGRKHYINAADGKIFKFWSDRMDKEYLDQTEEYKKSKNKK